MTSTNPLDILNHALKAVGIKNDSDERRVITSSGVDDIDDLTLLTKEDLDGLRITISKEGSKPYDCKLAALHVRKILALERWYDSQGGMEASTWLELNAARLQTFMKKEKKAEPKTTVAEVPTPDVVPSSTPSLDDVAAFKRGTKRNLSDYPTLKNDEQFLQFDRRLRATAAAHGIKNAVDPEYLPASEELALFEEQRTFLYYVLSNSLRTMKSRNCLLPYADKEDGHGVYMMLKEEYASGVAATNKAQMIQAEIRNLKLNNTWNSSRETFVNSWLSKVNDLEEVQDSPVADDWKMQWLREAIAPDNDLCRALDDADALQTNMSLTTGKMDFSLDFDAFLGIVRRSAQRNDLRNPRNKTKRRINNTNKDKDQGGDNANKNKTGTHRIPDDEWKKMTWPQKKAHMEARGQWDPSKNKSKNKSQRQANKTAGTDKTSSGSSSGETGTKTSAAPGDAIKRMLANTQTSKNEEITVDGKVYRAVNITEVRYSFNKATTNMSGSLIDSGANGGLAGEDVVVLDRTGHTADINGIGDTTIVNLDIGTVAGLVMSTEGPIIAKFYQYAIHGKGKTIHSSNQLGAFGLDVNERPSSLPGGRQTIIVPDGHIIPLAIRQGLSYMDMRPPTAKEMDTYPHVDFTADEVWDPSALDQETLTAEQSLDEFSEETFESQDALKVSKTKKIGEMTTPVTIQRTPIDYEALRPRFGWIPALRIRDTLRCTSQWYRSSERFAMRKHFKTRFPAANVNRLHETVAMDTLFSDTPAHDDGVPGHGGCTMIQIYVAVDSRFTAGFPMASEKQVSSTFQEFIRRHGAPDLLMSDNAKAEIGFKMQDILRQYAIADHQSEPEHQHQNAAERRIQDIKRMTNGVMDRTGTPARFWLICTMYVIVLFNHLAQRTAGNVTPMQAAYGHRPDVSKFMCYHWWQPVYYRVEKPGFPSQSRERKGRWAGPCLHKGDDLTYWVLDDETQQLLPRSAIRAADLPPESNLRADFPMPDAGEDDGLAEIPSADGELQDDSFIESTADPVVHSLSDAVLFASDGADNRATDGGIVKVPHFTPEELIGKTFVYDRDGEQVKAEVIQRVNDADAANHQRIKMLLSIDDGAVNDLISYVELSDLIEQQTNSSTNGEDAKWGFHSITGHEGPLVPTSNRYKGSKYNLIIQWDDGSLTTEPLSLMIQDDPVSCAVYGCKHDLLEQPGWKRLKKTAERQGRMKRQAHIAKTKSKRHTNTPIYQFGVQVPRNHQEAMRLDAKNGNNNWAKAEKTEMEQLFGYGTFKSLGKTTEVPDGYQKIRLQWVYAVKHDLRHKARCVAGGHLTDPCSDTSYAGVVSLQSLRIALLAGEANGLQTMVGDIGNAYLEAYTREKICFVAGDEFGDKAGNMFTIVKALYGLRTSGARFHEALADTLRDMGFMQCRADPDVWMRDANTHWEYVCVYVDDLMAVMVDPRSFFDQLTAQYGYKLKGVGPISYHLGADFGRDTDGTMRISARSYIKRMLINFETMFDGPPHKRSSPLDKDDSPELDTTPELGEIQKRQYMSLIGTLQWCVTLGRFDIHVAVMTLSRFRSAPRKGHLDRAKQVYGYLRKYPDASIRFRTGIPKHEDHYKTPKQEWAYTVYGNTTEELPSDAPAPRGKAMRTTTFVDANLLHCRVSGKSATGVLHLVNQTPIDWFSKRQSTVETATYGSEFVAARLATEQIISLRLTLCEMGIPIDGPSWMFGDNQGVLSSSNIPNSTLTKRHNALAYHRVRSAIAAGIMYFVKIHGHQNVADVLTKLLPRSIFWDLVQPLLFWKGDTNTSTHE